MTDFLKTLLSLSLSGTLLILVIFLLKPLWKNRLSKQWQYYIWLIVIVRLLLPFTSEINLVGTLLYQLETAETKIMQPKQFIPTAPSVPTDSELSPITDNNNNDTSQEKLPATPNPPIQTRLSLSISIFLIWFVIALILFIRKITIYQGFSRYIRAGQVPVDDIEVLNRFAIWLSQAGIKKPMELSIHPLISSPLLMGFFYPRIVLPNIGLNETDFYYTIFHELTHYKRHDMFYKWLVQLVICVYWFNPFVYLMGREINRACELSCDETIIRHMNAEEKAAYGDTLLNAMETNGNYKNPLACVTLNESKLLLKERLDAIMKFRKTTRFTMIVSIILIFVLCFGATTAGAYTNAPPINGQEPIAAQPEQQNPPASSTIVENNLTLIEKEYTMDELISLHISGLVIQALSEDITIIRGGSTLKFAYYIQSQDDYTIQREDDSGKTRWDLCFTRIAPIQTDESKRTITISIPEEFDITFIEVNTESGNIYFQNCVGRVLLAESESGQIHLNGCSIVNYPPPKGSGLVTAQSF